jgi:hypothetical protein
MSTNMKDQMEKLVAAIGANVDVEYVHYGRLSFYNGKLRGVNPYEFIDVTGVGMPFIGYGCAVRNIVRNRGGDSPSELLFHNPFIPEDYDARNDEDADGFKVRSFGEEIAKQHRDRETERDRIWRETKARLDAEAQAAAPDLIEEGAKLVRPEMVDEWRAYAETNTKDGYSAAVIKATVQAMQALADGKTPKEAENSATAAETGFQMGATAKGVSHFSPRGDEFRAYWNRQYVSEERAVEADKTGAVANPAILEVK